MTIKSIPQATHDRERQLLAPFASFSRDSLGRFYDEPEHLYRGPYQRDRDRILHSSAFRRLSGKMQVFTGQMGDYHRTRLTHTMEVASIARTIGRALRLNEDLIEALALLHDIGHPPFGHAGEDALNELLQPEGGFSHNQFALVLVTEIENPYAGFPGLNLTREVLDSQVFRVHKQKNEVIPLLEAQVVDLADSITYDAHDVDDAVKLNLLTVDELRAVPLIEDCLQWIHHNHGHLSGEQLRRALVHALIDSQVNDILQVALEALSNIHCTADRPHLQPSSCMAGRKHELERFLYEYVYRHHRIMEVRAEAQKRLKEMFVKLVENPALLPNPYQIRTEAVGVRLTVRDYLAGMTDNFCMTSYEKLLGSDTHKLNLRNPV